MATRAEMKLTGLESDLRTLRGAVRVLRRRGQPAAARIAAKEADNVATELADRRAEVTGGDRDAR